MLAEPGAELAVGVVAEMLVLAAAVARLAVSVSAALEAVCQ